jgi:hypothetical protein
LPEEQLNIFNDLLNIIILMEALRSKSDRKPIRLFKQKDMINSLCVEANVLMEYLKKGHEVQWLSPFQKDPPDLRVRSDKDDVIIDFEVKCRNGKPSIDSAFGLMKEGLKSLKSRKTQRVNPSVIVIHNNCNLNWKKWLIDNKIQNRLSARFSEREYAIVSGVIFSGGVEIKKTSRTRQTGIQIVAFRSNEALKPLPVGFLTKNGRI